MERIETHNHKSHSIRNLLINTALASVIGFSTSSCDWKITQKDINEQRQINKSDSINLLKKIDFRKDLVNRHNTALNYPKTEANQDEIDNYLCMLEEQIDKCDKEIRELSEKIIDNKVTLNKMTEERWIAWIHTKRDPNEWDYLLQQ